MYKTLSTIAIFALLFLAAPVSAQQPSPLLMNFQGKLTDTNQVPINGPADITFSIYDADTDGTLLWCEDYTIPSLTDGIFNVLLGSIDGFCSKSSSYTSLADVFTGEDRWLDVQVGSDPVYGAETKNYKCCL